VLNNWATWKQDRKVD